MQFDTVSIRSMLGLRFRDATTERPVSEGLSVRVRRPTGTGPSTQAVRTVSGAYVAQGLDGLRPYERAPGEPPDPVPESRRRDYHVEVRDRRQRFVPAVFSVRLPYAPQETLNGLYPVVDPPPAEEVDGTGPPEPTVYLFSAVQRPVPVGQAVVYADLVTSEGGTVTPAAHAVLEVRHSLPAGDPNGGGENGTGDNGEEAEVWFGVAGADGRVAVQFPVPQVRLEELSSDDDTGGRGPPGRGRGRPRRGGGPSGSGDRDEGFSMLTDRRWSLEVRVRYEPSVLQTPARAQWPLLTSIFDQGAGALYETPGGAGQEGLARELVAGSPLVLRTENRSELQIAAASDGG